MLFMIKISYVSWVKIVRLNELISRCNLLELVLIFEQMIIGEILNFEFVRVVEF